jgi:hypothetical protein
MRPDVRRARTTSLASPYPPANDQSPLVFGIKATPPPKPRWSTIETPATERRAIPTTCVAARPPQRSLAPYTSSGARRWPLELHTGVPGRSPRTGRKQSPRDGDVARISAKGWFLHSSLRPLTTCTAFRSNPRAASAVVTFDHSVRVKTCTMGNGDVSALRVCAPRASRREPAPALAITTTPSAARTHARA